MIYSNDLEKNDNIYLIKAKKKSENIISKKIYYMLRSGISSGNLEELNNNNGISLSLLGFYLPYNDKIILGWNGYSYYKKKQNNSEIPERNCNNIDERKYTGRYFYGGSYLQFKDKIGDGLYWRIDAGFTAWGNTDEITIPLFSPIRHLGVGFLTGIGYSWETKSNPILLELNYNVHHYGGGDGPEPYRVRWVTISIGSLF